MSRIIGSQLNRLDLDALMKVLENPSAELKRVTAERDELAENIKKIQAESCEMSVALFQYKLATGDARKECEKLRGLLSDLIERIEIPDADCSCCISPPCSDCVEYGGLREAVAAAKTAIKHAG